MTTILYGLVLCFSGPTSCGKTMWIVELLKSHKELCTHMPKKLIWIYGVEQLDLLKTIKEICAPHLLKKFGPHINVNLLKVFLKT